MPSQVPQPTLRWRIWLSLERLPLCRTTVRPPPQGAGSRRRGGRGWWSGRGRARPPPASSALGPAVAAAGSQAESEREIKERWKRDETQTPHEFICLFTFAANFLIEFPLIGPFGKSAKKCLETIFPRKWKYDTDVNGCLPEYVR